MLLDALLSDQAYALELVVGPSDAGRRPVRGIHSSDYERATAWLDEDWVLLTNGLRLVRQPERQRTLVKDLTDARATALGFGIGIAFQRPPPALLDEAARRELPVFTVPLSTSFATLLRHVHGELVSSDAREFRRLSTIQQYLLGSFEASVPDVTIVERLAGLIDATVGIVAVAGRVDVATGELPLDAILAGLAGRIAMVARLRIGDRQAVAVPVGGRGGAADRWLVAYGRRLTGIALPAVQLAAPLLEAVGRMEASARRQQQAVKAQILESLIGDVEPADRRAALIRARDLGISLEADLRVLLVRAPREDRATADRDACDENVKAAASTVESVLGRQGVQHLIGEQDGDVVALLAAADEHWGVIRDALLAELGGRARIALGRSIRAADEAPTSFGDARLAMTQLAAKSSARALRWEDIDLGTLLISEVGYERIAPRVESVLSALRDHPMLLETLVCYFECGLDAATTADCLHVHANTLRYRLRRVEERLGYSLHSPAAISAIHLALTARGREAI